MAKLTTKQLVEITPFATDVKKKILKKLPKMSSTERFSLARICWETISFIQHNKIRSKLKQEIHYTAHKGRKGAIDLHKIEEDVFDDLQKKIEKVKKKKK